MEFKYVPNKKSLYETFQLEAKRAEDLIEKMVDSIEEQLKTEIRADIGLVLHDTSTEWQTIEEGLFCACAVTQLIKFTEDRLRNSGNPIKSVLTGL